MVKAFADRLAKAREGWRVPTVEELRAIAIRNMPKNPHLDAILARAEELASEWMPAWLAQQTARQPG